MLDLMRKHAGTWMIKALLGAIVVVFVFWGVGSWTGNKEGRVATVNGESISIEDYRSLYNRMLDQARQNFGAGLNDELIKAMQFSRQALDQLIDRALLRQAASSLNLQISDEELARSIRGIDAFKDGNAFSRRRYEQLLSLNRLTPEQFEAGQRDTLLVEKLLRLVTEGVKVSDIEAEEWYQFNNSAVKLEYVLFPPEKYTGISASAEEVQQHYDRLKETYKTEPEVQVRYLHFKPDSYTDKVAVTPEEIQNNYESNPERFIVAPTVEARHILIKVTPEAEGGAQQAALDKIRQVLDLARQGRDFGDLAKQYSEDPTQERGGSLGAFRQEAMVKPFADAAFALKPGEISEPVRTQFGWHLIKTEKFNEGRTRTLEEARDEIETQLKGERTRTLAYDEAEAVYDAASAAGDLAGTAAARRLNLQTTGFFTRRGPVKGVNPSAKFSQAAFQLPAGEVSDILDFGDGFYLLQVAETRPARVQDLAQVEDRVKTEVARDKQIEQSRKDAEALLAELRNGVALDQAAKKFGVAPQASELLKREESIPVLGNEPEVMRTAFNLSEREPLPKEAIRTPKGFCAIRLTTRQSPPTEGFEKEKAQISERLIQQKKSAAWQAWLEQLRKQGQIERRQEFLEG
jgi:peptidyl-prolyl cis-trans isomerase D